MWDQACCIMNWQSIETSLFDRAMLVSSMFDRDKHDEASLKHATILNKLVSNKRNKLVLACFKQSSLSKLEQA